MVKADVVRRVRLETGISQGEAEDLINELLEIMRQTLELSLIHISEPTRPY